MTEVIWIALGVGALAFLHLGWLVVKPRPHERHMAWCNKHPCTCSEAQKPV